jgi:hypothetical protein
MRLWRRNQADTESGNTSDNDFGGFRAQKGSTVTTFKILDSTVSGNSAAHDASGGGVLNAETTVANSTIAFNHSYDTDATNQWSAGFTLNNASYGLTLQSSLLSNNTRVGTELDFNVLSVGIASSENLIVATYSGNFPAGTIANVCPRLGPLRDNGGPTWTHALLSGSAGINQGSNVLNLSTDQRGPTSARVAGGVADIGAYEVIQSEIVFNAGFDGCP